MISSADAPSDDDVLREPAELDLGVAAEQRQRAAAGLVGDSVEPLVAEAGDRPIEDDRPTLRTPIRPAIARPSEAGGLERGRACGRVAVERPGRGRRSRARRRRLAASGVPSSRPAPRPAPRSPGCWRPSRGSRTGRSGRPRRRRRPRRGRSRRPRSRRPGKRAAEDEACADAPPDLDRDEVRAPPASPPKVYRRAPRPGCRWRRWTAGRSARGGGRRAAGPASRG